MAVTLPAHTPITIYYSYPAYHHILFLTSSLPSWRHFDNYSVSRIMHILREAHSEMRHDIANVIVCVPACALYSVVYVPVCMFLFYLSDFNPNIYRSYSFSLFISVFLAILSLSLRNDATRNSFVWISIDVAILYSILLYHIWMANREG